MFIVEIHTYTWYVLKHDHLLNLKGALGGNNLTYFICINLTLDLKFAIAVPMTTMDIFLAEKHVFGKNKSIHQ